MELQVQNSTKAHMGCKKKAQAQYWAGIDVGLARGKGCKPYLTRAWAVEYKRSGANAQGWALWCHGLNEEKKATTVGWAVVGRPWEKPRRLLLRAEGKTKPNLGLYWTKKPISACTGPKNTLTPLRVIVGKEDQHHCFCAVKFKVGTIKES
ncbi:hypothetical protein DVH24_000108 [Malus domestica]|uniref:Uncharacterized protein n=1 Tax=Malus domestica TaxID=3750 RepID=A0A498IYI7_MALDO|nr:hypothetical protein DVH24_000108 [Malus domestica]